MLFIVDIVKYFVSLVSSNKRVGSVRHDLTHPTEKLAADGILVNPGKVVDDASVWRVYPTGH